MREKSDFAVDLVVKLIRKKEVFFLMADLKSQAGPSCQKDEFRTD